MQDPRFWVHPGPSLEGLLSRARLVSQHKSSPGAGSGGRGVAVGGFCLHLTMGAQGSGRRPGCWTLESTGTRTCISHAYTCMYTHVCYTSYFHAYPGTHTRHPQMHGQLTAVWTALTPHWLTACWISPLLSQCEQKPHPAGALQEGRKARVMPG